MARDYGTKANDLSNLTLFSCFYIRAAWSSHLGVSPTVAGFLFKSTRPVWHEKQCFRRANRLLHAIRRAKPGACFCFYIRAAWSSHLGVSPHRGGISVQVAPSCLARKAVLSVGKPAPPRHQAHKAWSLLLLLHKGGVAVPPWSLPHRGGISVQVDPSRLARKAALSVGKPASPRHQAHKAWSLLFAASAFS